MEVTVAEVMELADMHAHAKITEGTPAEMMPRNLLQRRMEQIVSGVFSLECQLTEARLEIASLQGQLEAVGAGGVGALVGVPADAGGWLAAFKAYARQFTYSNHEATPANFPEKSRWFEAGYRAGVTAPQPAPAQEDAEISLLIDAKEAIWQPANPELCERLDAAIAAHKGDAA